MSNTLQIEIPTTSKEQSDILIAELSEIKFYAFEENDNSLSAFVIEDDFNEGELNTLLSEKNISYTKKIIGETNWNTKWESEFEPIVIENFVAVRAAFHKPITNVQQEIIITPKMSFGTGHHATTYLMLQEMQHVDFTGKTVLDFGTGTGILAIMAKKLNAKKVVAIDNDEWSINNAMENIATNDCADIVLLQKDNLNDLEKFDIILANINLNVISNNIQQLKNISKPSATLLLSGFFITDESTLINNFTAEGFNHILSCRKDNWLLMLIIKS
jgi:ribosomal protein L11 methyltransferase